jgi:Domain of unknown function (DUF2935)
MDSLAEKEKKEIQIAKEFKAAFHDLLEKLNRNAALELITREAEEKALKFRVYKLALLQKHLTSEITIHLAPTFLNHMVNEIEEYIRVLKYLRKGEIPPILHELHHHLLWLLDAAGHAGAISDTMDAIEKNIKKKGDMFTKQFEQFYLKAVELTGYLRTNLSSFPALKRLNREVNLEIQIFQGFLKEIEELELSKELLSTFSALMADHMMREESYYITKLVESTGETFQQ